MIYALVLVNALIFSAIALLHFYWAMGGKTASANVVPTTSANGSLVFKPSFFATIIVACGLVLFALVTLSPLELFRQLISREIAFYGNLAIAIVFFVRAIGDFKYVGFFKKIKETPFATNDTRYYVPLCLFIGLVSFLIAVYQ